MPRKPRPWIVTRHDPIEKLEDNLWAVQGDVPGIPFKRRMFIIKRSDGTLMFSGTAMPVEDSCSRRSPPGDARRSSSSRTTST